MADFVTVENFAPRIDMPPHAIYRAIREGIFPFPIVRIGRQIRIDARAIPLNQGPDKARESEPANASAKAA